MNSNNKELEGFIKKRNVLNKGDYLQAFLLGIAMIALAFKPVISVFLILLISLLNFQKLIELSKIPCPRCSEKFGKISLLINTSSLSKCQNCNLEITENTKEFSKPLLMTLAIVVGFMGGILIYLSVFIKMNIYGLFLGVAFMTGAIILLFLSLKNRKT